MEKRYYEEHAKFEYNVSPFTVLNGHLDWGILYIQDIGHEGCIPDEQRGRGKESPKKQDEKLKKIFVL